MPMRFKFCFILLPIPQIVFHREWPKLFFDIFIFAFGDSMLFSVQVHNNFCKKFIVTNSN